MAQTKDEETARAEKLRNLSLMSACLEQREIIATCTEEMNESQCSNERRDELRSKIEQAVPKLSEAISTLRTSSTNPDGKKVEDTVNFCRKAVPVEYLSGSWGDDDGNNEEDSKSPTPADSRT